MGAVFFGVVVRLDERELVDGVPYGDAREDIHTKIADAYK
jgi:hypothetical protein